MPDIFNCERPDCRSELSSLDRECPPIDLQRTSADRDPASPELQCSPIDRAGTAIGFASTAFDLELISTE